MIILGLNDGHDGSACILIDGKIVSALSNERVTRIKKEDSFSDQLIDAVLKQANVELKDIDIITCTGITERSPLDITTPNNKKAIGLQNLGVVRGFSSGEAWKSKLKYRGNIYEFPCYMVHHHLSHAASAYYTSPFDKSACFTIDASGYDVGYIGNSSQVWGEGQRLLRYRCPQIMFGNVYSDFTEQMGIGPGLFKSGSTMALASFGTPLEHIKEKKYFDFMTAPAFKAANFDHWLEHDGLIMQVIRHRLQWHLLTNRIWGHEYTKNENDSKEVMDLAASLQYILERLVLEKTNKLYETDESFKNICLSGGTFLNCSTNTRILKETPFENIHLFPGCGDDGTAVGSALYIYYNGAEHHRRTTERHTYTNSEIAYLGPDYNIKPPSHETIVKTAKMLDEGKVIAWCQGRSEFGPRALGNRSILADPRRKEMIKFINDKVKYREWYRPFAPSVLEEKSDQWFDLSIPSPFMLFTTNVKVPSLVPAICHVDNTSRIQTVNVEDNKPYYELISEFEKLTGVPMVLNTSLNGGGEPLIESPDDVKLFLKEHEHVDALVLGDEILK
jgi:carbamoyltransferase